PHPSRHTLFPYTTLFRSTVSYAGSTATLAPTGLLLNNTVYTAKLETTVTAADGVALAAAVSWSFTTVNAAPTVLSTTPLNNATADRKSTRLNSSHLVISY